MGMKSQVGILTVTGWAKSYQRVQTSGRKGAFPLATMRKLRKPSVKHNNGVEDQILTSHQTKSVAP